MTCSKSLCVFTVLLVFLASTIQASQMTVENRMKVPFKGYFFVQRMYPGSDPIDNIKESEFHTTRLFLEANDKMVFLRAKEDNPDDIEDSINLIDLYDGTVDNAAQGRCCKRVTYENFPAGNDLKTIIPAIPNTIKGWNDFLKHGGHVTAGCVKGAKSNASKRNPIFSPSVSKKQQRRMTLDAKGQANKCLSLYVPEEARWRICHESNEEISKLQLKIIFSVLKAKSQTKAGLMEKFLHNIKVGDYEDIPDWNWENQEKWGGKCQTTTLQSPINLPHSEAIKADHHFGISAHLTTVHTLIKKNFNEVIVAFLNFGGILKLAVDGTFVTFTPQFMSFRFPGESIIDGKRALGEILLNFVELSSERKTQITNGLVFTIPIVPTEDATNLDNLDNLNMEFWRHEILKKGTYVPKKFSKKHLLRFDLNEFMNKFMKLNPKFLMHFGSSTIPPCLENVIHITVDKPIPISGCQFRLLRENALVSHKPKEIHTRIEKPKNERSIYVFPKEKFGYLPSVIGLVPQSFNKYLLAHKPTYKYIKKGKKKVAFKALFKKKPWYAKKYKGKAPLPGMDGMDCSIPEN